MRAAAVLLTVCALAALVGLPTCGHPPAPPQAADLPVYQRVCQQCHGAAGEGNRELETPSIAGQPGWYLTGQLQKFRSGMRGAEPRDTRGQQMRAIALALGDGEVAEVAAVVASFPLRATQPTLAGADVARGHQIYEEQCIDCHRYNGAGEKVFGSSPLTAFQDWYLAAQLEKFRQGVRGYHEADEKGQQMRHLTSYLSEQDTLEVSAYIATLAGRYPPGGTGSRR